MFWDLYDKKVGEKSKLKVKYDKLSIDDKMAIFEYLPKYKKSQPDKKYRKNPETFINQQSWNDELIPINNGKQFNQVREQGVDNLIREIAERHQQGS